MPKESEKFENMTMAVLGVLFFLMAFFLVWQFKLYLDDKDARKASIRRTLSDQIAARAVTTEAPLADGEDTDRRRIEDAIDDPDSKDADSLGQPQN